MAYTAHINFLHIIGNLCTGARVTFIHVVTEPRQMICRLQHKWFRLGSFTSHACWQFIINTIQFYIELDFAFDGIAIVFSCTDIISGAFSYSIGDFEVNTNAINIICQVRCSRRALPQGATGFIAVAVCRHLQSAIFWSCIFIKIVTADFFPLALHLSDCYGIVAQFQERNFLLTLRTLVVLIIFMSGS